MALQGLDRPDTVPLRNLYLAVPEIEARTFGQAVLALLVCDRLFMLQYNLCSF